MPNYRSKPSTPTKFGPSKTIPGQSLKPSELLKRHLAGTLPPIDLSKRYEHHFDEEGKQIAEPLPLEMHEVHKLSVAIRQRQYEEALEHRKKQLEKHKENIIAEYEKLKSEEIKGSPTKVEPVEPAPAKGGKPVKSPTPKGS